MPVRTEEYLRSVVRELTKSPTEEAWLSRMINPKLNFRFYNVGMENGKKVTLLEIPCAKREPVKFGSNAMIRIGSNLKPLFNYPEKEQELWRKFDTTVSELRIAKHNASDKEVIQLLDFSKYYDVMQIPIPSNRVDIMDDFCHEKFLRRNGSGNYDTSYAS